MPKKTEEYTIGGFGSGIIYGQPQIWSPLHTPINWQLPKAKRGSLVVIGRKIFRVEDVSYAEGPICPKAYLIDVNTGETEIMSYYDIKNPNILFIKK